MDLDKDSKIGSETKSQSGSEYWRDHILRAQRGSKSNREYCETHRLNLNTFYVQKKRLGLSRPQKRRKSLGAFVKVDPSSERPDSFVRHSGKEKVLYSGLPDPTWLAIFLKSYLR